MIFSIIAEILGGVIALLSRNEDVDPEIVNVLRTVRASLEASPALLTELEKLSSQIQEMTREGREPTHLEFELLQARALSALSVIRSEAARRKTDAV